MRRLVESSTGATWIAEHDGQMAGFAIVEWESQGGDVIAYIQTLEVVPRHRGQGAGGELMRRLEESAESANAMVIWLHVDAENHAAIRLYEQRGYRYEGREEHYYAADRPALVYQKQLS